jgi:uncharacterized protein (TIGR00730 family)
MEQNFRPKKLTAEDIKNGCISLYGESETETQICIMNEELRQGLTVLESYQKSITIFGSARTPETDPYYQLAVRIGSGAVTLGKAVITGGGPGIMQAGNQGASTASGVSIGMTIVLPHEQYTNPHVNVEIPFYYFFTRKTAMRYASQVYLFFPGGYGTLDELMETLTLIQTGKIDHVPVILVGEQFWKPLDQFIRQDLVDDAMISEMDPNLYIITDNEQQILDIIKNAPERVMK